MFIFHAPHFLPPRQSRARALALFFLTLAPFAFGALALALGQDANWDLRNYHFYNAFAFLNGRYDRDLLPSQTPYFYNPLMDLPFYWGATHFPARVVGFALGFGQGLNFVLLFIIAHALLIVPNPRHKTVVCAALAALGLLGGGGIAMIGTTFGDNVVSLGVLLSAALVVRHLDRLLIEGVKHASALALLFGVPVGMAMGLKLPYVIYCVGLCGGFLVIGGAWTRRFALAFAFGLGILTGIAATMGHWAFFLQTHFGNPVFPYFNDIFRAPLAPATSARDMQYVPQTAHDILLMPFIFADSPYRVGEIPWRDWRIPVLYVLLPAAFLIRWAFGQTRTRADAWAVPDPARYLVASFVLSYGVWVVLFAIYRYAVTIEMIAPLLLVIAVGMLPLKMQTRALLAAFVLAVVSASVQPGNWGRREAWTDRFIEADIPAIDRPAQTMLLMAGIEPYAHLLPLFPPEMSFVRIQSNFSSPEQDKGINRILHAKIDAHRASGGHFLMLIPDWQLKVANDALGFFGLTLSQPCQKVVDKLYQNKPLSLCPVTSK